MLNGQDLENWCRFALDGDRRTLLSTLILRLRNLRGLLNPSSESNIFSVVHNEKVLRRVFLPTAAPRISNDPFWLDGKPPHQDVPWMVNIGDSNLLPREYFFLDHALDAFPVILFSMHQVSSKPCFCTCTWWLPVVCGSGDASAAAALNPRRLCRSHVVMMVMGIRRRKI